MDGFQVHHLDNQHCLLEGELPAELRFSAEQFDELWKLHPSDYHEIEMHGRTVKTPRWQQAYGADYHYTGRVNRALPVPEMLFPIVTWCQDVVSPALNGVLLNWYDLSFKHYIGKHRDSTVNMVEGAPIVTISLGTPRTFRLRPWRNNPTKAGRKDFVASDGTVFVMPYETNLAWTHEVPQTGPIDAKRISITLRAFSESLG